MQNVVSALTARTQLGQIPKRSSEKDERFVVDRRGKPSVIIMSVRDIGDSIGRELPLDPAIGAGRVHAIRLTGTLPERESAYRLRGLLVRGELPHADDR